MKTQEVIFSTYTVEEKKPYHALSVWKNGFIMVKGKWREDILIIRLSREGEDYIEVCLDPDEVKRLKESL